MAGMNPYALPNIIAFVLLLVLSLAVIFQNSRDKSNRLLFALCLNLALSVGAGGLLHLSVSESQANFWNKWPYVFGIPSYIWAIEYALQISGRSQRLKEKLIGIPIAVHRWIIYGLVPFWLLIIIFTDLILAPAKFYTPTGWEHGYGSLFPVVPVYGMYLLLCHCFILYRGIKTASNTIEKRARIVTFIALISRDVFGFFIGVIFPYMGLQAHAFYGLAPIFMCFLLTYGLLRYQWETIRDLKDGLEEKVALRTKELEEALTERNQALAHLNQELAEATVYVRSILPQPISHGEIRINWKFVPSASLGGDAFGYYNLDEDHFVLYLIDVSGHGVGAALLSVSVMNALRSQSLPDTDFKDPQQVLAALNVAFPGEEHNDMFFTIWYGVYKKSTRELTYASGGHPPALLIGDSASDDSRATPLRTVNNVIGALSSVTYKKSKHLVGERTTLYIFSDGVYEVEKADGSMWQFDEFADFMNKRESGSQSKLDRLYGHAENIRNQANFEDDFTIVEVAFGKSIAIS
jgi:serine phosphatase RsbU (regulator of sigma subunit)